MDCSFASPVTRNNWKQCVWKIGDLTDDGKIKVRDKDFKPFKP